MLDRDKALPWITASKILISGLVAFAIIQIFHLDQGFWAVVTVAAVTQAGFDKTFVKAAMRAIGTLIGAVLGYAGALLAQGDPWIVMGALFILIILSSYIAVQPTIYSYAGIVAGMTMSIIIFFSIVNHHFTVVAINRTVEVLLGVGIQYVVSVLLWLLLRNRLTQSLSASQSKKLCYEFRYWWPAIKVAIACMITFLIWYFVRQPQGYWATITCLLIMEESLSGTLSKGLKRFWAHLIALVIGFVCALLLMHVHDWWRGLPVMIALAICGYIIGMKKHYSSMGNTIGIALTIMLLATVQTPETFEMVFARFYNVLIGVGVAFIMLYCFKGQYEKSRCS